MKIPLSSRLARRFFSLLPRAGLVQPPDRPQGVSAIVRVLNENSWLEASIKSISGHVDEIVVVDTGSTDGSLETLQRLAEKDPKLKVFSCSSNLLWDFSNFALSKTSYRWVIKWDPDLVSPSAPAPGIGAFVKFLLSLDPRFYYYVNPGLIELAGDFSHQFPGVRVRSDMEAFTYSQGASYVPVERVFAEDPYQAKLFPEGRNKPGPLRFEGLHLPIYYRLLSYGGIAAYHLNIKPGLRHLLGYFYLQWLASPGVARGQKLEEYALEQVREKLGQQDLESAAAFYMREYVKRLLPYDEKLGALPENLRALAAASRFRVTYRDGKPADREE